VEAFLEQTSQVFVLAEDPRSEPNFVADVV
jgi:hypothetical protein